MKAGTLPAAVPAHGLAQRGRRSLECTGQLLALRREGCGAAIRVVRNPLDHEFMEVDDLAGQRLVSWNASPDQRPKLLGSRGEFQADRGTLTSGFVVCLGHGRYKSFTLTARAERGNSCVRAVQTQARVKRGGAFGPLRRRCHPARVGESGMSGGVPPRRTAVQLLAGLSAGCYPAYAPSSHPKYSQSHQ